MSRSAFSLIELLIVVVIIVLIYALSVTFLNRDTQQIESLTLQSMPEYLMKFHQPNSAVTMRCMNYCKDCLVYVDENLTEEIQNQTLIDDKCRAYRFDNRYGTINHTFTPYFDSDNLEKEVCFEFTIYPNGTNSEFIIECGETIISYDGYFQKPKRFFSLSDVVEYKRKQIAKVSE